MVIMWIASAVGLLVVAPVVIILANAVIAPALEAIRYSDDILEHGVGITAALEPVPLLATTRDIVGEVKNNAVGYVDALRRLAANS